VFVTTVSLAFLSFRRVIFVLNSALFNPSGYEASFVVTLSLAFLSFRRVIFVLNIGCAFWKAAYVSMKKNGIKPA
ncbi:hypothetical protein Q6245_29300, partial [Klebsiella pneumoniae]|uniref:hypothetical protein n=1 Tax=Klebsiella pneumoniae TaxID=573 RepID=UPI00273027EB